MGTKITSISFDEEVLKNAKILSKKEGRSLSNYTTQAVKEKNKQTKQKIPKQLKRRVA